MTTMLEEIIELHGGAARWKSLEALEAEISVRGLLFTSKRVPALNRVRVRAATGEPRFTFFDFPEIGQTGELFGHQEVCIMDRDKKVLARRVNPRSAFGGPRRWFKWDRLDHIYFVGYAAWNYMVTPFLFLRNGFECEELKDMQTAQGRWSRLRVTFPDDIPTHCRTQIFYFDQKRFLRRLDYTAEVVGRWAHAAQCCDLYREFGGLQIPTRRRVRPLITGSKPLPAPTLVAIDVHDVCPIQGISAPASVRQKGGGSLKAKTMYKQEHQVVLDALLSNFTGIKTGKMFGLPGYYVNGKLFAYLYGEGIGVKVPEKIATELLSQEDIVPFQPFGRPKMREWVQINRARSVEYESDLDIFRISVEYVGRLVSKRKKRMTSPS